MRSFEIPKYYKSSLIARVKDVRNEMDKRKKDFSPTLLDFGPVRILLARHFGFCFGVENAIEVAYKALEENPDKKIYLLSQMIHNPTVNDDLEKRGVTFIMDTVGNQILDWNEITKDDMVIIPAFGITIENQTRLEKIGVDTKQYNTTCPFVERVWKKSLSLGNQDYTVIIHGKHNHEETRATFSHTVQNAHSVIIFNLEEAKKLAAYILGEKPKSEFYKEFKGKYSDGFDPEIHLEKIGVVNQTTMLATETEEISAYLKEIIEQRKKNNGTQVFADTRDTLCYATNDNQQATIGLLEEEADMAIVVGGYNSSNTSHIVELCEQKFPVYFVSSENEIESEKMIHHFDVKSKSRLSTENYLPAKEAVTIVITSGASCPDTVVESVINRMISFFGNVNNTEDVLRKLEQE